MLDQLVPKSSLRSLSHGKGGLGQKGSTPPIQGHWRWHCVPWDCCVCLFYYQIIKQMSMSCIATSAPGCSISATWGSEIVLHCTLSTPSLSWCGPWKRPTAHLARGVYDSMIEADPFQQAWCLQTLLCPTLSPRWVRVCFFRVPTPQCGTHCLASRNGSCCSAIQESWDDSPPKKANSGRTSKPRWLRVPSVLGGMRNQMKISLNNVISPRSPQIK